MTAIAKMTVAELVAAHTAEHDIVHRDRLSPEAMAALDRSEKIVSELARRLKASMRAATPAAPLPGLKDSPTAAIADLIRIRVGTTRAAWITELLDELVARTGSPPPLTLTTTPPAPRPRNPRRKT